MKKEEYKEEYKVLLNNLNDHFEEYVSSPTVKISNAYNTCLYIHKCDPESGMPTVSVMIDLVSENSRFGGKNPRKVLYVNRENELELSDEEYIEFRYIIDKITKKIAYNTLKTTKEILCLK